MKRYLRSLGILTAITAVIISCSDDHVGVTPRPYTLDQSSLDQMSPIDRLGRVMFYDTRLSVNNSISCASCHKQSFGFSDNKASSTGFQNEGSRRNALPIVDVSTSGSFPGLGAPMFWDGRADGLGSMVLQPIFNHVEMGMDDGEDLVDRIRGAGYYHKLFDDAFPDREITLYYISMALGSFVGQIQNGSSMGIRAAFPDRMTPAELIGKDLFENKFKCNACHRNTSYYGFSDPFANIGLEMVYDDPGREEVTGMQTDHGKFRIPSLINIALSAPYMHDGRFANLDQVLDHYSQGIQPHVNLHTALKDEFGNPVHMNMSMQERDALKAYLGAFTDEITVTSNYFSDPFH